MSMERRLRKAFGIIAGLLCLLGVFSPWWGIVMVTGSSQTGFVSTSIMYGLFPSSDESSQFQVNRGFTQTMNMYVPIILVLALVALALAFIGGLLASTRLLAVGIILVAVSLLGFALLVDFALGQNCQGTSCIRQLTGSIILLNLATTTWGFQAGFYASLGGAISMAIPLAHSQITRIIKSQPK